MLLANWHGFVVVAGRRRLVAAAVLALSSDRRRVVVRRRTRGVEPTESNCPVVLTSLVRCAARVKNRNGIIYLMW